MADDMIWIEFDKDGRPLKPDIGETLTRALADKGATDLLVISHGWKNNREAALRIYDPLWDNTAAKLSKVDPSKVVVAGVLWPSVPFRDHIDEAALTAAAEGGGLAAAAGGEVDDLEDARLSQALEDVRALDLDPWLGDLAWRAAEAPSSDDAAKLVRRLTQTPDGPLDPELAQEAEMVAAHVEADPKGLLTALALPPSPDATPAGGALGIGGAVGKVYQGGKAAVARLLAQTTYFHTKVRAGTVGQGLGALLAGLDLGPVRLHLVGHSFGARLVTAATAQLVLEERQVASLTLLQGAFSHNALSPDADGRKGAFHTVPSSGQVGVIAITHTHNDKACTIAYAVASRLSLDVAKTFGGADDKFGAMGANGAQHIETRNHQALPGSPETRPVRGAVNNYLADAYVVAVPETGPDAHGNVFNPTVGALLASVMDA